MSYILQAQTIRIDATEVYADMRSELQGTDLQEVEFDVFVTSASGTLESERLANDGKDCFVVPLPEITVDELYSIGVHAIYAGTATLINGNRLPCLMVGNGALALSADIVLDAHLNPGETLLMVFDCKDGVAVLRAPFTAQLQTQLQVLVAVERYLPRGPVDIDGVCPTRTKFPLVAPCYFGF